MKLFVKKILLVGLIVTCLGSCKKMLDVNPGTELTADQMYRDIYDANAAVMGIYGKFMELSDRYIILNELRGDLLEFTDNADAGAGLGTVCRFDGVGFCDHFKNHRHHYEIRALCRGVPDFQQHRAVRA